MPIITRIFDHLGVPAVTLSAANQFAQANLLRTGERWDAQVDTPLAVLMRQKQDLLISDLRELGLIDEVLPKQQAYDHALVLGSLVAGMKLRIGYLEQLRAQGYQFKDIALLGGKRPLTVEEQASLPAELVEKIQTEGAAMLYLFQQSQLTDLPVQLINAPMKTDISGKLVRPNTDDTIRYFAETASPGSCLVVSNNPYVKRQTLVAQRILDQSKFPTEGAGPAANLNYDRGRIRLLMDEFARTIHEMVTAQK